jgi:glucose-6-phosphate 1-dehydrogenase
VGPGPSTHPEPNELIIRIDPDPGARIRFLIKKGGEEAFELADFDLLFEETPGEDPEPYERLLGDALKGDSGLFARQDSVEETWRIVQPLLEDPPPVETYEPGTWGPASADGLVRGVCHWQEPWLPAKPD